MNALVIYDSTYGSTEEIAQAITDSLAQRCTVRLLRVNKVQPSDLKGVDLLVLGCPTLKRKPTPAVQAFLDCVSRWPLKSVSAAVFDTRDRKLRLLTGSAASGVAKHLRKAGVHVLVAPHSFFVAAREGPLAEHELERATAWAHEILETLSARGTN
jgi:flavodoxin